MSSTAKNITTQQIGAPVADFRLLALTGEQISLSGIVGGKKGGVVAFWSGVCSHCARYDAYLNGFQWQHPELGIVAVASRQGETADQLRTTARERRLTFTIVLDRTGQVAREWSTRQTPRVFLLDSKRMLRYRGAVDNYKYPSEPDYVPYLEPAIAEFLAGKQLTRTETASFGCAVESIYYQLPKAL